MKAGRVVTVAACVACAAIVASGSLAARTVPKATAPADLMTFLGKSIGLNAKQITAIDAGQLISKVVRTAIDRDVVVFGIVQIDVPRIWFVNRFKETDLPPRSPGRTSFGTFSKPALPSDVGELMLSPDDVKDLSSCRPRSCSFKLPAASMAILSSRVPLGSPNATIELAAGAREQMAAYVNDYRQHGNDAMVVYDDNASVKSSDALAALLADSPPTFPSVPEFQRYLQNPFEPLDSVTSMIFWSQDQMPRTRPILSIHELSFFSPNDASGATLISVKQLWADHYLEANVDVLTVLDRAGVPGHETSDIYLLVQREYRFDNLPNNRLYSIRNRVADGLKDQMDAELKRIKQTYEESFHTAKVPN